MRVDAAASELVEPVPPARTPELGAIPDPPMLDLDIEPPGIYAVLALVEFALDVGISEPGIPGLLGLRVGVNPLEACERLKAAVPVLLSENGPSFDAETVALCHV